MQKIKRAIAYSTLAISVTVGGVIIGATVIAPVIGTNKKIAMGYSAKSVTKTPAEMLAAVTASTSAVAPITSAPVTAASEGSVSSAPTPEFVSASEGNRGPSIVSVMMDRSAAAMKSLRKSFMNGANSAVGFITAVITSRRMPQLPANVWLAIAIASSLIVVGLAVWRLRARRIASRGPITSPLMVQTNKPAASIVIAASTKLPGMSAVSSRLTGRIDRTPRAVVALAETGAAPAEIARRTGMPLDAVAMCLSMYQMGVRQLQPPTA